MSYEIPIRYLTTRECFRLMGQDEESIDRILEVVDAKRTCYTLAGNSIVVDVLATIFKGIYIDQRFEEPKPKQTSIDRW